jgi:photosynthetic reaction center H subunit
MPTGAITGYIDVAQLALYAFWIFFAGLIWYLRREDKREGYPLVSDRSDLVLTAGFPPAPPPKTFLLPHGGTVTAPRVEPAQPAFDAIPVAAWPGAPMHPVGNGMWSGAGPAASALRTNTPDLTFEASEHRVVPLRVATEYFIDPECPNPITMEAVGADGVMGGVVTDLWIDRAEVVIRYIEVTLVSGVAVLVPMPLARIDAKSRRVVVQSVLGAQFAGAPITAVPDQVTLREEDQIAAYFASGNLYADPRRAEPIL